MACITRKQVGEIGRTFVSGRAPRLHFLQVMPRAKHLARPAQDHHFCIGVRV
jgi:hypothetical protein